MELEHRVYVRSCKSEKWTFFAAFELSRWQWAEKLAAYISDKGNYEIEIRTLEKPQGDGVSTTGR